MVINNGRRMGATGTHFIINNGRRMEVPLGTTSNRPVRKVRREALNIPDRTGGGGSTSVRFVG
jgi:hypothetical protein